MTVILSIGAWWIGGNVLLFAVLVRAAHVRQQRKPYSPVAEAEAIVRRHEQQRTWWL